MTTATVQQESSGMVRVLAILIIVAGALLIVTGIFTWFNVSNQLADENITVAGDAERFGGEAVEGPLTAYEQAAVISKHALEATGGLTYAQLESDDPARQTALTASFLRASLYTSVVAFGIALMAGGIGLALVLIGTALLFVNRPATFEVVIDSEGG
ncbi:MAG: aromatic ring-opening dioxygenase LigA [Actinobacteria bacterium]|nr:aromatic ring-opening dioxygenase LigA [Actinomycetota bacterium]